MDDDELDQEFYHVDERQLLPNYLRLDMFITFFYFELKQHLHVRQIQEKIVVEQFLVHYKQLEIDFF